MEEVDGLRPIEEMLGRMTVAATFGEPIREGNVTLIPVASVVYGFGYGAGSGGSRERADVDAQEEKPEAHGAGGGGGGMAKPLGFIRVDAGGVK